MGLLFHSNAFEGSSFFRHLIHKTPRFVVDLRPAFVAATQDLGAFADFPATTMPLWTILRHRVIVRPPGIAQAIYPPLLFFQIKTDRIDGRRVLAYGTSSLNARSQLLLFQVEADGIYAVSFAC